MDQTLQTISDANATIYGLLFPSVETRVRSGFRKITPANGGGVGIADPNPGPPGGCLSRKPDADGNPPRQSIAARAYDCVEMPPLALAKTFATMVRIELQWNVPRTVAEVSGGEYFQFKNVHAPQSDLLAISNHLPKRYLLSFNPRSPHKGMHSLTVAPPECPELQVKGRRGDRMDARNTVGQ